MSNMRQRSPTNHLPPDDMSGWQTMRARNPDGTSTVYRVHESMTGGGGGLVGGAAPAYGAGGPNIHTVIGAGGSSGGCNHTNNNNNNVMYATPASRYPPYHDPYQVGGATSPNIVFVKSSNDDEGGYNDYDDDSGDDSSDSDEEGTPHTASSSAYDEPSVQSNNNNNCCCNNNNRRSTPRCSSRNTPFCIGSSMLFAVGFIVGYVFLIDFLVDVRAPPKTAVEVETQAPPPMAEEGARSGLRGAQQQQYYFAQAGDNANNLPENIYLLQQVALQPVPQQKDQLPNENDKGAQQTSKGGGAKQRPLKGGRSKKSREDKEQLV